MTRLFDALRQRIVDLLRDLASRPGSLFCLLLAANAIALPYRNFFHDANLYGVQVLNRVYPGRFAGDLFFQYGSQDKYSVFALAAAPLAARLGLSAAFFVLYLASNALLLFALQRFVRALVRDPIISTLALLFVAVTEVPFGGLRIFHVNEPFLTPRIAANTLVLLGLERLLAGRVLQAWNFVLIALPLHPLMAFPGVLIIAGWLALTRWRTKTWLGILFLAVLVATVFLLDQPLASRWLGRMDDAWRASIHRVNIHLFPQEWTADDWLRIALSFAVVLAAAWYLRNDAPVRALLLTMSLVAALGLTGEMAACFLPYALPLQGQPYRWLWPLEFTLYPLGFLIAQRWWATRHQAARLAALGLLLYLNDTAWDSPVLWLVAASAGLLGVVIWRGMATRPRVPDWPARAAVFALGLTLPLGTARKLAVFASLRQQLAASLGPVEMLQFLTALVDPLCWLALMVLSAVLFARLAGVRWKFALSCLSACLASGLIFFVWPQTQFYEENYARHGGEVRFAAAFLAEHSASGAVPTVYWPTGQFLRREYLWLDLHLPSYFHLYQVMGNLFNSGNAAEGARRAQIVKRFELERWRKENPDQMGWVLNVYQASKDEPAPEWLDFVKLCQDEQLDFAVLPQDFKGLYAASNGKFFIYDCRAIRARLKSSPHDALAPP